MRIHCLTTLLDGSDRFEKDDARTVDDERGARFVANGWAKEQDGPAVTTADGDTALSIDNSNTSLEDNHG